MKMKGYKRIVAGALATTMLVGTAFSTSAANLTFTAPTSPMEVDDTIITASVHRAASVMPEILGMNTKSGFSMINGSMPTQLKTEGSTRGAESSLLLGAFGTNNNESPNPYYYNYFYNFYAQENGLAISEDAVIIPKENIAASPVKADTTIVAEYGTSISLAGRPDVLIGSSSQNMGSDTTGYDALIADIRSGAIGSEFYQEGDESYAPYTLGYYTTTTYDMIFTMYTVANTMNQITLDTGKTGRYGDPLAIADQFADYVGGVSAYVLSQLDAEGKDKKNVAVVQRINSDGTFTLANTNTQDATSTVRGAEYMALVANNIADTLGKTTVNGEEIMTADAIVISASNGGGQSDTVLPNTEAGLRQALGDTLAAQLDDKIVVVDNPATVYGITMNSIENGTGYGYFIGCVYPEYINPVYACAYFYEQFYHVTDANGLQSVTDFAFSGVTSLPEGLSTSLTDYNTADMDAKFATGKAYFLASDEYASTKLHDLWTRDISNDVAYDPAAYDADVAAKDCQTVTAVTYVAGEAKGNLKNASLDADAMTITVETAYGARDAKATKNAAQIYVTNAEGQTVATSTIKDNKTYEINLADLTAGKYTLVVGADVVSNQEDRGSVGDYYNGDYTVSFTITEDEKLQGLQEVDGTLAYYVDGEVDTTVTGFVIAQDANTYYVQNGYVDAEANTIAKSDQDGKWYKVTDGKLDNEFTGVAKNQNGWFYLEDGVVDFTANTIAKNPANNTWWKVTNGKVDFTFTGVAKNQNGWFYMSNGKVDFTANTIAKNPANNTWWKVTNGKVDFTFTGVAKNQNGWFYMSNGKVDFTANTVAKNPANNTWWKVTNGKVDFNYNGLAKRADNGTWWYIQKGQVNFNYTGRATNAAGTWNVVRGQVRF